ncbi:efflux transporter, hydrophobe/amphiphile efflux-3 (HAE3) family [Methanolacinia petrolearia DSM 11571]|uniref:Efflux transporter, hydrophobe/amphiphile efflux-3 (HAE3) family n=2 Tax=Methanolacinia TaxID=230355 RepID=E1RGW3_METP4|nr:efflux transporter, hydrophobe/amphiphile efflux-3 (HAE3) family [Methanolacinia petrolearia DSM 11571]
MLVIFVLAMCFMTGLQSQSMSDQYLDKSTPKGIIYDQYNSNFVSDTYILLIQTSNPTDYELMQDLLVMEEQIERLNYISSATSVADVLKEMNGGVLPGDQELIDEYLAMLPEDTVNELVPDSETALAYVMLEEGVSTDVSSTVLPGVTSIVDSAVLPPGVSIEITGNTPYNVEMQTEMVMSGVVLVAGAFILMFIVLAILFSNMRYWYLPIVLLMFSLVYTFGMMGLFGIPMNNGAIAALPILLGLGIDYAVQFHARFDEERRKDLSVQAALSETVSNTGPAVLLAMLATTMGFIAMLLTPIPMIRTFGLVAIIGVSCSYLTSLFGFPAIATLTGYVPKTEEKGAGQNLMRSYDLALGKAARRIIRVFIPILIISISIAYAGIALDPTIPIDTSTKDMAPADLPAQLSLDKVEAVAGSVTPMPFYIKGDDLSSVEVVQWIGRFGDFVVSAHQEVTSVDSIATVISEYNNGEIPDNQEDLDEILASIPDDKISPYLQEPDEGIVSFSTISLTMNEQGELKDSVETDVLWLDPPPSIALFPTGDFDLYTNLVTMIADSKDRMTFTGFILILLFLLIAYRRVVAATPIVPIICIVGWNTVAMLILGMEYNPISACLGSMTIGVASEYTILIMERYTEEYDKSGDRTGSIEMAVKKIGSAVTVSGLVTASGFSALMLSSFPIVSSFGLSTVIAVGFSLIGAIVIMPAVLVLLAKAEGRFERKKIVV